MQEAYTQVEAMIGFDPDQFEVIQDDWGENLFRDKTTGAIYSPTIALFKVNALVGEDDVVKLDQPGIWVAEVLDSYVRS